MSGRCPDSAGASTRSTPARFRPPKRIEHPIVASNIEARMFDFEEVRTWERNPQFYADVIGTSLAGQALFAYAPEAERARRIVSKLRQVPRLVQAARDNIKECPGHLRQDRARELARHPEVHRCGPAARIRRRSTTCTSSATSPTPRPRRRRRSRRTSTIWRTISRRAPKRRSGSDGRISKRSFELEEGITLHGRSAADHRAPRARTRCRRSSASVAGRLHGGDSRPPGAPPRSSIRRRAKSSRPRRSR